MLRMPKNLIPSLFLAVLVSTPVLANDWQVDGVERVVAIADVHGAYEAMVETLRNVDHFATTESFGFFDAALEFLDAI